MLGALSDLIESDRSARRAGDSRAYYHFGWNRSLPKHEAAKQRANLTCTSKEDAAWHAAHWASVVAANEWVAKNEA